MALKGPAFQVKFNLDTSHFMKKVNKLDYKTRHNVLKRILRDTARKVYVRPLKASVRHSRTGRLKASMGTITGKSKQVATIFAGPRMSTVGKRQGFQGWVANILEYAKPGQRTSKTKGKSMGPMSWGGGRWAPGRAPGGGPKTVGAAFYKAVAPIRPSRKTHFRRVILRNMKRAETETFLSIQRIVKKI